MVFNVEKTPYLMISYKKALTWKISIEKTNHNFQWKVSQKAPTQPCFCWFLFSCFHSRRCLFDLSITHIVVSVKIKLYICTYNINLLIWLRLWQHYKLLLHSIIYYEFCIKLILEVVNGMFKTNCYKYSRFIAYSKSDDLCQWIKTSPFIELKMLRTFIVKG